MLETLGRISDVAEELARRPSAIASLSVIAAGGAAPEHSHANPYLWLHVMGAHREAGDGGEALVDGPAAMFFPAGSAHGMAVRERGLASVIIEFDAGWLRRRFGAAAERPRLWIGGEAGRRAASLARLWLAAPRADPFAGAEVFLRWAMDTPPAGRPPSWLGEVDALIAAEPTARSAGVARRIGVTDAWLARAYRHWRGEGLADTRRRRRIEAAACLLEAEGAELADVAAAAGFCDQSHMTRAFRRHIGRTPGAVQAARLGLAGVPLATAASPSSSW